MRFLLALLLLNLPAPSHETWNLTVGVRENEQVTWLTASYETEEECTEAGLTVTFSQPTRPTIQLITVYCEREPFTT